MFEKAIIAYYRTLKGNGPFASIFFHTSTGLFLGSILFLLLNVNGEHSIKIFDYRVPVNYNGFLVFTPAQLGLTAPLSYNTKVLEYLILVFVSIGITVIFDYLLRKVYLVDALSPIREKMIGQWSLELIGFAGVPGNLRDFKCKVWFSSTEASKLRAHFYNSNELAIDGSTHHISLSVSGSGKNPSQIDLSISVESDYVLNEDQHSFLYWLKLNHTSYVNNQKSLEFKGPWYQCKGPQGEYKRTGQAKLVFESRTRD